MRDKRKVIFCFVCLIIIIVSEILLYKKAYNEDKIYKDNMQEVLTPISADIESRGFIKSDDNDYDIENGTLSFVRTANSSDYGKLKIQYDLDGQIKDVYICLEYSLENYSDDIFSDVYYVLSLVGIDLYEEQYIDALNILLEDPTQSNDINDEIQESKLYINDNEYTFSLKKIKNDQGEKIIQFCLE